MQHHEASASIDTTPEQLFAFIDDHARLSGHMSRPSWRMGGGQMELTVDEGHGQAVGSHIRLSGQVFGLPVFLDEVVTRYEPPRLKVWETVGEPRLLVVGPYRMTVEVQPQGAASRLRVAIDWDLPAANAWLGRLFGAAYARWCVRQMLGVARDHFRASAHRPWDASAVQDATP